MLHLVLRAEGPVYFEPATYCITLQHIVPYCYISYNIATYCTILLHILSYCIRTLPRGGMYWEIPEGNLQGRGVQKPRPREISRAQGDVFPNASRLEAVYVHSLSISREVLISWCDFHFKLERSPS